MADSDSELLGGEYELLDLIASGGTSQVWEAKQVASGQIYAVKMLMEDKLKDSEAKSTLKHEASICQKFSHPNIVKGFDLKIKKDFAFFVMERVPAPSLKSLLRNRRKYAETTDQMVIPTMAAIAEALHHMHEKGYLHRDIKPDNILASRGGDVRLIDFSLAGKPDSSIGLMISRKKSRKIMGTRTYIPPEMVRREGVMVPADVYSFGISLYEAICGRPPFMGGDPNDLLIKHVKEKPDEPSAHNPNCSEEGDAFVLKLIAKNPKDRPQSMDEIARELKKLELWTEPPPAYYAAIREKEKEAAQFQGEGALDSRADAERDPNAAPAPKPKNKPTLKKPAPKPEPAKPAAKPQPAAQQAPPQPQAGFPPGQMPPGQMPPGYAPGQMPPGQMPPGYPQGYPMPPGGMPGYGVPPGQMPPGFPPGQMPPGQFPSGQMPPGQMPPGQFPPGQMPPGYPAGGQPPGQPPQGQPQPRPAAPQPAAPQPTAPQPAAPQPAAPQPAAPAAAQPDADKPDEKKPDDLPLMTELPDIM